MDSEGGSDHEIERRIRLPSASLSSLNKSLMKCRSISLTTEIRVYEAIVRSTLLYGCETSVVNAQNSSKLDVFDHNCFHHILRAQRQERGSYEDICERCKQQYPVS